MAAIANNCFVEVAYTLRDDSGSVIDTTADGEGFRYTHGQQQILPALERILTGMHVGEEKEITLRPEEAYGHVDPDAVTEVAKTALPPEALVPGTELRARRGGETMLVTVKQVRDDSVVLDLNHPFAGKTLHFHLRIVQVVPEPV